MSKWDIIFNDTVSDYNLEQKNPFENHSPLIEQEVSINSPFDLQSIII